MSMENKPIVVLVVEPGERPRLEAIDGSLEAMQGLVGGSIEMYMPFDDEVAIICNEEGKLEGLPLNRALYNDKGEIADILVGDFFICYAPAGSESFLSLPEDFIHKYAEMYERPERFFRNPKDDKIVSVKANATNEYLGVHWQFHEHDDAVDIEFYVILPNGVDCEDIDWHIVPKDSEEYKNIDAVAKEWAGDLATDRVNAVLGVLKSEKSVDELVDEAQNKANELSCEGNSNFEVSFEKE